MVNKKKTLTQEIEVFEKYILCETEKGDLSSEIIRFLNADYESIEVRLRKLLIEINKKFAVEKKDDGGEQ